jgi:aminomethyltransferase
MDVLDIEAGIPRPARDYIPATDGDAPTPSPWALSFDALVDMEHTAFNGRANLLQAKAGAQRGLVGVEIESDVAAPHTPLLAAGRRVGHTLSSAYSPTLRRAIALAQIDEGVAKPGTQLALTLPPCLRSPEFRVVPAVIAALPFIEPPDSLPE